MNLGSGTRIEPRNRFICATLGLVAPVAFYALIRLLPDLLGKDIRPIMLREVAIVGFSFLFLALVVKASPVLTQRAGLKRPRASDLGWGLATAVAAIVLPAATAFLLTRFGYHTRSSIVIAGLADKPAWLIVTIAVGAALSEEIVFRSVMIPALEFASGSLSLAVIVSSAAFALMHLRYGVAKLPISFVSSLVFAGLFIRRRSLASCAAAHLVVDLTALIGVLVRGH